MKIEDITKRMQDAMSSGTSEQAQLQAREQAFDAVKKEYGQKMAGKDWNYKPSFSTTEVAIRFTASNAILTFGWCLCRSCSLVSLAAITTILPIPVMPSTAHFSGSMTTESPCRQPTFLNSITNGVRDGEPIFVIGNPGHTERLKTVAELEFDRDLQTPATIQLLKNRSAALQAYNATAKSDSVMNEIFSYENSLKAYGGQLEGSTRCQFTGP